MDTEYKPPPKYIKTEGVASILSTIPALSSVVFSVSGYIFIMVGDNNGAKTFFVISLISSLITILLTIVSICTPRKKKIRAFIMLLVALASALIVFLIMPEIISDLDFWSIPVEIMAPTEPPE